MFVDSNVLWFGVALQWFKSNGMALVVFCILMLDTYLRPRLIFFCSVSWLQWKRAFTEMPPIHSRFKSITMNPLFVHIERLQSVNVHCLRFSVLFISFLHVEYFTKIKQRIVPCDTICDSIRVCIFFPLHMVDSSRFFFRVCRLDCCFS